MSSLGVGPLNYDPLNSTFSTNTKVITELVFSNSGTLLRLIDEINDTLVFNSQTSLETIVFLLDSLSLSTQASSSFIVKNNINEIVSALDTIVLKFNKTVIESVAFQSVSIKIFLAISNIVETVLSNSTASTSLRAIDRITSLLLILDELDRGIKASIVESIIINNTVTSLHKLLSIALNSINISNTATSKLAYIVVAEESIDYANNLIGKSLFKEIINNSFVFSIGSSKDNNTYNSYLFSPETSSVTTYSNYNFNGCAIFNKKALFYNINGLYEHGGSKDDGISVKSIIGLAALSFGTTNLKIIPNMYLGVTSTDQVILKVRIDGKAEITYKLNKFTENLQTQKIDIGKGLKARYFQFEIVTEADVFSLESVDFHPIELKRKL